MLIENALKIYSSYEKILRNFAIKNFLFYKNHTKSSRPLTFKPQNSIIKTSQP